MKRLAAPSSWMLDKLSGTYAPRPAPGPHKIRESLPLVVLLRNRLKYALTGREVLAITAQRLIKVDNKVRTEPCYPTGFMDVVSIEKSGEHFRILYDVKGGSAVSLFACYNVAHIRYLLFFFLQDDSLFTESLQKKPPTSFSRSRRFNWVLVVYLTLSLTTVEPFDTLTP